MGRHALKTCTVCKNPLPLTDFHRSKRSKDGYGYRCRTCDRSARESYRKRNYLRFLQIARRKNLKHKYGITLEDYERMLTAQNFRCAICATKKSGQFGRKITAAFAVDHCHNTGKVRGLLCNRCNRVLGMMEDSPALLEQLPTISNKPMAKLTDDVKLRRIASTIEQYEADAEDAGRSLQAHAVDSALLTLAHTLVRELNAILAR